MNEPEYKWKSLGRKLVKFNLDKDPFGWIQWKGTDVCVDIHCVCGEQSHFDGEYMYFIKCPKCGRVYEANGHIQLLPLTKNEIKEEEHAVQEAE
jgi:hypothetical protein